MHKYIEYNIFVMSVRKLITKLVLHNHFRLLNQYKYK